MTLHISVLIVLITAFGASAEAGSPPCQSSVTAVVQRDTIFVYHNQVAWGCDEGVEFKLNQIGTTFILREFVVLPKDIPRPCLCCYDFKAVIAGVHPGIHLVRLFHANTGILIGEVGAAVESHSNWGRSFLKQTVMSPCGGFTGTVDVSSTAWGRIKVLYR